MAHIRNDQLLCEDCFLKLGQGEQSEHTVVLGEPQLAARSNAIAPTVQNVPAQNPQAPAEFNPSQENLLLSKFLMAGESLLWKRSFSKGIIHRYLTFTEAVTNIRAVCIDDENLKLLGYVPLNLAVVNVDKEQRVYEGVHSGVSSHGMYAGTSSGHSVTYGNVNFFSDGKIILTFCNVRDPQGLKSLVMSSKKSTSNTAPL